MKQIYYIIFIFFGIVLFLYYNNSETLSIGGVSIRSREKNIQFNMVDGGDGPNASFNLYELDDFLQTSTQLQDQSIDKDSGPSIENLSSENTIIFLGIFKINKNGLRNFGGLKNKYVFISYSAETNLFSVIYCKLNGGTIDGDELVNFNIEKTYEIKSGEMNGAMSNLEYMGKDWRSGWEGDDNYITLYLNAIDGTFPDNKRTLELYNTETINKGILILEYLSFLCTNNFDCNGRGTTSGIRPNCENCVCDNPTIYTGDNCEKELCHREDCNNRGEPSDWGNTRDIRCIDLPADPASPEAGGTWSDGSNGCDWYQGGLMDDGTNTRCESFGDNNFPSRGNANKHCCACSGGSPDPATPGCDCECDDPIYTGDNCEKEFCTRENCHNHGSPRDGATLDEDCDCVCDDPIVIDTCSCLNEYGAPYDEQNCEMIMSEVAPYSNEQPIEIARRKDQYGNYCKFGYTIKYEGVQCKDLLCTNDDINCNHGTPRGILSDDDLCICDCETGYDGENCENKINEDKMTNFLLIPDINSKWGSGNDISGTSFSWQKIIEDMINKNAHYRNLIDTTNTDWFNENPVVTQYFQGKTNDGLPDENRKFVRTFHSLLYLLNDILPDCLDKSVIIYISTTTNAIVFILLAYYKKRMPQLLLKIKSIVILGGSTIEYGSIEFYQANRHDDTYYNYFFQNKYGMIDVRRDGNYNYNYSFLENIPVICLNTQHGYGHLEHSYYFVQFQTSMKRYDTLGNHTLGNHTFLLPTTQSTGDASVRTSKFCQDNIHDIMCDCRLCNCSSDLSLQMVETVQIDLDELWMYVFHWSLQDNLYDREKIYLRILEIRSDMFRKINKPEYYPSSLEHSACSANFKYIVKKEDPLTVNLFNRLIAEQTGYFVRALPRNTDYTINLANLNILSIYQKINDILVLIHTTIDVNKQGLDVLTGFLSKLRLFFQMIPDISTDLSQTTLVCRRDTNEVGSCARCIQGSMMRKLNEYINDIFDFSLHCEKAQDQIDDSLGISIEDRERGQHGPLENFPGLIFALAESAVETMFNSLFFEFDEEVSKYKLLTLEESKEKINKYCSSLIGSLLDGGCFEGRLDAIINLVFVNNEKFEVRINQTVEQNVYLLINTLQNYLCLNSTNSKYNTLGNNGYLQQWTVENHPLEARPKAIHWILDKFDNNLQGIISILSDNNVFGKPCSDGDFTEQAFRDVIQQAIELVSINDQDFPWGGCRGNDVVVPCFNLVDEPLDDGTTYGVNITETCRIRSTPKSVIEEERCNYPTICTLEEGLCDGHPEVKLKPQCEKMGATWTDGSCTMNPGTGGANPDRCIYQRMEVSEIPSMINNEVWTLDKYS